MRRSAVPAGGSTPASTCAPPSRPSNSSAPPLGGAGKNRSCAASGETARQRDPQHLDQLTPQELQIVRFVGQGATNREVAAQLFLSPQDDRLPPPSGVHQAGHLLPAELIRLRVDERFTGEPAGIARGYGALPEREDWRLH